MAPLLQPLTYPPPPPPAPRLPVIFFFPLTPCAPLHRYEIGPSSHKRARVSTDADSGRSRTFGGASKTGFLPAWQTSSLSRSSGGASHLPPVAELPSAPAAAVKAAAAVGGSYRGDRNRNRNRDPRSASPTPSYASSSTLSAATTTATALSSRASLSSCRSSFTSFSSPTYSSHRSGGGGQYSSRASHRGKGSSSSSSSCSSRSSYSLSRHATSATSGGGGGTDYFPKPSSSWSGSRTSGGGVNRWRRGSPGADRRRDGSRDRYIGSSSSGGGGGGGSRSSRDSHYGCPPPGRRSGGGHKDYASEADSGGITGRKRNRSSSRERVCSSRKSKSSAESSCSGVECARCLEWCRYGHAQQRQPITRTLQVWRIRRQESKGRV